MEKKCRAGTRIIEGRLGWTVKGKKGSSSIKIT